jgi:signal transduction histidine kinase
LLTGRGLQKGLPAFASVPPDDQSTFIAIFNKALSGEPVFWEKPYILRGNLSWYEYSMVAVLQSRNTVKYVCYTSTDITERRDAQKRTMNAVIETEERERKRFSEDLHDELSPLLSTIKIYVNTLHSEPLEAARRQQLVDTTNELINQAIQTSKSIANNLSPSVIKRFGLISALNSFCQNVSMTEKFEISFHSSEFESKIDEDAEIIIYRIITELINNSLKHSLGNRIEIALKSIIKNTDDYIKAKSSMYISYSDNGTGFDFEKTLNSANKGHGLQNIVTRVKSLNGNYYQNSNSSQFQLTIEIP